MPQFKRYPQSPGRLNSFRVRSDKTDTDCRHAFFFYKMGYHAYGACTAWSDWKEQDGIYIVLLEQTSDFPYRRLKLSYVMGATNGIVKIS